jgi:universal stress protein E
MQKLHRILVVVDHDQQPLQDIRQAIEIARHCGAQVELFSCEAEQAYVLEHRYDREGVDRARADCVARALTRLRGLRTSADGADVEICVDAECESPLYEGIVRKVLRSAPDLVIKRAAILDRRGYGNPDSNDWQLMRTCPATLMLTRGRVWQPRPRFAAAVDVSEAETAGLARNVLQCAHLLAAGCHATLEVVYGEAAESSGASAHLAHLEELCAEGGVAQQSTHVVRGEPDESLPDFVGRRAYDLIILGALAHRPGEWAQVGSLTSRLLEALNSDFVLVRPPQRQAVGKTSTTAARSVRS